MNEPVDAFLRSLCTTTRLTGRSELSAEQVNALGAGLGLDPTAVLHAVETLKQQNAVELIWGGKLTITAAGQKRAAGRAPGAGTTYNVTIAQGGIFAQNTSGPVGHAAGATGSNVAFGGDAVGQGAILLNDAAGDLAGAIQALRSHAAAQATPEATKAGELAQALDATLQDLRQPMLQPEKIREHRSRIMHLLDGLKATAAAGSKLLEIGEVVEKGIDQLDKLWP
jgi:hypothetical protein